MDYAFVERDDRNARSDEYFCEFTVRGVVYGFTEGEDVHVQIYRRT